MDGWPRLSRRACVAAFGAALAGCEAPTPQTRGVHSPIQHEGPAISLDRVATGFRQPIAVADVPGTEARFVADKFGTLSLHDGDGLRENPVLSVSEDLVEREDWETGLLGLALHPDFADDRRFYVRYSARRREGTPRSYNHTAVLAEYRATADLGSTVDGSGRTVLAVPEPGKWHNAGGLAFGPDGYLYVPLGDGGSDVNDTGLGHAEDWYDAVPGGNGQDVTENLLGSILRIDVDDSGDERGYAVPEDNPLVGAEGRDELYAWGFRNPWRIGFHDGDLFAIDVGNDSYEEVNAVVKGGNYGWNVREGLACHEARDCPGESPRGNPLIDPVIAYPHELDGGAFGMSITGGQFYDSAEIPSLRNQYVFADLSGKLFASRPRPEDRRPWPMTVLDVDLGDFVLAVESAPDGGVYVLTTDLDGGGTVSRIAPP